MSHDFLKYYPVIFHCISNCPKIKTSLRTFQVFRTNSRFNWSFRSYISTAVGIGATALGVQFIEKHFTIDRNLEGPDQKMSMLPEDMKRLVNDSNDLYKALGQRMTYIRKDVRDCTKILYARQSIAIGDILGNENAVFLDP